MSEMSRGRCLTIPVSLVGLVTMWLGAVLLLGWTTFGGPEVAAKWGLLGSAAAAAWTVIYGLARQHASQHDLIEEAFHVGRESVRRLR